MDEGVKALVEFFNFFELCYFAIVGCLREGERSLPKARVYNLKKKCK